MSSRPALNRRRDLNGTLLPLVLDCTQALTPLTISAAHVLDQLGISMTQVTGRMFRSAAGHARDLGLDGPLAAHRGTLIGEVGTGRLLRHDPLPLGLTSEILGLLEPRSYCVNLYEDDEL
jgi:hydroxymethylpyrimidine pyrophosphatase-like HAD family hydrolase